MLFNSIEFFVFLPTVFLLYWFIFNKNILNQNLLLLVSSYYFYANWDYRFLFLLFFSTLLDYYSGNKIYRTKEKNKKRFWFWLSIGINIGILGVFKYFNFFSDSFEQLFKLIGFHADFWTLQVVLPVGISFYTFHGVSYVADIYNEKIEPEKNFINYSVFVSFFPLLVAGPIERATHLIPQVKVKRDFNYSMAINGLKQILWGLFKKIVIADNCAIYANEIFTNHSEYSGSTLLIGALFFAFQIYGDFSGYTDIALGVARLFGFELMRNFNYPYFSKSVTEFWRRWHISLSTWFNDYIFTPLIIKWRDWNNLGIYFALFITFFLSGLWHGAGWNFIIYGSLHGIALIFELMTKKKRKKILSKFPERIVSIGAQFITFLFVTFCFIFFRSTNFSEAISIISAICSKELITLPLYPKMAYSYSVIILVVLFLIIEWFGRKNNFAIEKDCGLKTRFTRYSLYYFILFLIIYFGGNQEKFIYFQF
jgi:D-alanyl-lipoteichoic acid acyltransferase DltB (MBOAT superfamily)